MKINKLQSLIETLKTIIKNGKSLAKYCEENNESITKWYKYSSKIKKDSKLDKTLVEEFYNLYNKARKIALKNQNNLFKDDFIENNNISEECIENDERAETSIIRDSEGKVSYYKFKIFKRDKSPLLGQLTREEMNSVYRLYSYYGANITQREISRTLPEYSLIDFKRILRVFNITKACSPFAPHMYEEYTEEELKDLHLRLKENDFIKKLEKNEINDLRKLNTKLAKENFKLQDRNNLIKELNLKDCNPTIFKPINKIKNKVLVIWLSDLHIGAYNPDNGFYELPFYNENDIQNRLDTIVKTFTGKHYDSIYVVNLGDSVDSYNNQTTRGGHELPSVVSNKEMSELYINSMLQFFTNLKKNVITSNINYFCIGESNHKYNLC